MKKCFILLDEVAYKKDSGEWEINAGDIFDGPFRWNGNVVYVDGKLDIDNDDRGSFTLISSTCYPVLNVTENRNEYEYNFRFAFFGGEGYSLNYGSEICLKIGVRGRCNDGRNFIPIKYFVYVRLRRGLPGLENLKLMRIS